MTVAMVEVFDAYTEGKLQQPALTVRSHTRRLPKSKPALPATDLTGAIRIDGRALLVDFTSARNVRAGCKMCKPWKVNGVRTERADGEKFSDHRRREAARVEAESTANNP